MPSKGDMIMSKKDFVIEMLTLQFISGKTADSAAEYVELYKEIRKQIEEAYNGDFNPDNLL